MSFLCEMKNFWVAKNLNIRDDVNTYFVLTIRICSLHSRVTLRIIAIYAELLIIIWYIKLFSISLPVLEIIPDEFQ